MRSLLTPSNVTTRASMAALPGRLRQPYACPGRSERVGGRLPLVERPRDQLGALLLVPAVEHLEVRVVGPKVDSGRSLVHTCVAVGPGGPVAVRTVGGLHPDLAGPLELGSIRVPRPLALPEVEDARRVSALLRRFAPVPRGERAVLLPGASRDAQVTVAVPRDAEEAHCRRLGLGSRGERELPPQPLDRAAATLGLDRLAELLVDRANLRRTRGGVITD